MHTNISKHRIRIYIYIYIMYICIYINAYTCTNCASGDFVSFIRSFAPSVGFLYHQGHRLNRWRRGRMGGAHTEPGCCLNHWRLPFLPWRSSIFFEITMMCIYIYMCLDYLYKPSFHHDDDDDDDDDDDWSIDPMWSNIPGKAGAFFLMISPDLFYPLSGISTALI